MSGSRSNSSNEFPLKVAPMAGDVHQSHGKKGCGSGRCGCSKDLGPIDEDHEGPSAADIERFGDVTRTCPECHKEVYDEAEVCWSCGHAFTSSPKGAPRWAMATVAVLLVAFGLWYILIR